jgi:hypothetical protein
LKTAAAQGITSKAYEQVMEDRSNTQKYYEVVVNEEGKMTRVRRPNVFPPTLVGTHRPVFSPATETTPRTLIFFER